MPLGYLPGSHRGLYSRLSHRLFGSRRFSRTVEFRILRRWLPDPPARVLDVGAGEGELASQLALAGHRVTGIDVDRAALQSAQFSPVSRPDFLAADAARLPFAEASFDLVVCNSVLEHFHDDDKAIAEMARVVRPGGQVLITADSFPPEVSWWLKAVPRSWRREPLRNSDDLARRMQDCHRGRHRVVNYYRAEELARKLASHGLRVNEWRHYLNGPASRGIYELHILLKWLDFYNPLSRRLYPLFHPFTFPGRGDRAGYGLAARAVKAG